MFLLLLGVVVFLAYANGANDNFKGASTLYGSRTLGYKTTLNFATVGQIAGSIASVFLADELVKAFSGKGLVSADVSGAPSFLIAVGFGGAATVMLATRLGFPISTTHALTGALVGSAFMANAGSVDLAVLGSGFVLPLLLSPVLALVMAVPLYMSARSVVRRNGLNRSTCVCIAIPAVSPAGGVCVAVQAGHPMPQVIVAHAEDCARPRSYQGRVLGFTAQYLADGIHMMSAFALCFARGLNDTPKIVALLFAANAIDTQPSLLLVALAMAAGGWLHSRRLAETMGNKISTMNEGQALAANAVASFIVIMASKFGLPVSTTHVTVGAITGIGLVNGTADFKIIRNILLSWVMTLPCGAVIAGMTYLAATNLGA